MHGEHEEHGECDCGSHHMHGPMIKQFKLAKLDKKEKILKAELEFISQLKEIIKKIPEEKE